MRLRRCSSQPAHLPRPADRRRPASRRWRAHPAGRGRARLAAGGSPGRRARQTRRAPACSPARRRRAGGKAPRSTPVRRRSRRRAAEYPSGWPALRAGRKRRRASGGPRPGRCAPGCRVAGGRVEAAHADIEIAARVDLLLEQGLHVGREFRAHAGIDGEREREFRVGLDQVGERAATGLRQRAATVARKDWASGLERRQARSQSLNACVRASASSRARAAPTAAAKAAPGVRGASARAAARGPRAGGRSRRRSSRRMERRGATGIAGRGGRRGLPRQPRGRCVGPSALPESAALGDSRRGF